MKLTTVLLKIRQILNNFSFMKALLLKVKVVPKLILFSQNRTEIN